MVKAAVLRSAARSAPKNGLQKTTRSGKMVAQRVFAANKPGRAGFSPREALASLPTSGAEAPRGLKSALQNLAARKALYGYRLYPVMPRP